MNALLGFMHVVHKEVVHSTPWDAFHNSLKVSVSLCGLKPMFLCRSMDEMSCSSSIWCPSFSKNSYKTLKKSESRSDTMDMVSPKWTHTNWKKG